MVCIQKQELKQSFWFQNMCSVGLMNSESELPRVTLVHGDLKSLINGIQIT